MRIYHATSNANIYGWMNSWFIKSVMKLYPPMSLMIFAELLMALDKLHCVWVMATKLGSHYCLGKRYCVLASARGSVQNQWGTKIITTWVVNAQKCKINMERRVRLAFTKKGYGRVAFHFKGRQQASSNNPKGLLSVLLDTHSNYHKRGLCILIRVCPLLQSV